MTNWQVLRSSGNGSFDHEVDTRETALVLVLPRSEESIACSILRDAALFGNAYFTESNNIDADQASSLATGAERH